MIQVYLTQEELDLLRNLANGHHRRGPPGIGKDEDTWRTRMVAEEAAKKLDDAERAVM